MIFIKLNLSLDNERTVQVRACCFYYAVDDDYSVQTPEKVLVPHRSVLRFLPPKGHHL